MDNRKKTSRHWIARTLLIWAIETVALVLLAELLPGLSIDSWGTAIAASAAIGILNALLWPTLVYLTLPITVLTFGLLTLVLNGLIIWLASQFVPGMTITGFWTSVLIALGLTAINTFFSSLFAIDDDDSYYRNVLRKTIKRRVKPEESDVPGVFFLEIDGLSKPVLLRAIRNGHAPTLARWLETGSHRLVGWECDLSSQTGASQAGILFGNNFNMPAFRWYEKDTGRTMVSNHPKDAAEMEQRQSNGAGLLVQQGVSMGNVFSGDAPVSIFTFSTIRDRARSRPQSLYSYFVAPYNFTRGLLLFLWDSVLEIRAARRQRQRDIRPRLDDRGGVYPLLRATCTVFLRELSVYSLIGYMFAGVSSAYTTFVGYDEVAHHSGVERDDALDVLRKIDQQLARLESAVKDTPRPYHFVVLSDHGQSQGTTFKQRYHITLEEFVQTLLSEQHKVEGMLKTGEGWGNVNAVLTDAIQDDEQTASRVLRRAVKHRTHDGNVVLGPEHEEIKRQEEMEAKADDDEKKKVIVLASGNLGLIYFTSWKERMSYEQVNAAFPRMIPGLTQHEGIGFVLVRSEQHGPMAIGANGVYYLKDDRIEGEDPLAAFGPNTAHHLRRTDSFPYVADIMVNSFYDPATDEVAAFEELVGSHGGLGGDQMHPFLMFPAEWELENEKIVGADAVYTVLKGWLNQFH